MSDGKMTLLAHLSPRIAGGTENAAVEAIGYLFNNFETTRRAFNDLVNNLVRTVADVTVEPVIRVKTQVVAEDRSRPDFVGYDKDGEIRVIGEAKFWAGLRTGQGRAYLDQLVSPGPAVLLFVVPEVRMDHLWANVNRDVGREPDPKDRATTGCVAAVANPVQLRILTMTSWREMLGRMERASTGAPELLSDILQLQGLAEREDGEAFLPLAREELSPLSPRRMRGFVRLVDSVIERGVSKQWLSIQGVRAAAQYYGYGRYFRISGAEGDLWFGLNHDLWATKEETPLWLWFSGRVLENARARLDLELYDAAWFPVHLKTGVEYEDVLDDLVSKFQRIVDAVIN